MKHATFIGGQSVKWEFDKSDYSSLSYLCKVICEKLGGHMGSGAFQGPDYWAKEEDNVSLSIKAIELESKLGIIEEESTD